MRIEKISLNNIGPYFGLNSFDFRTTDNKNIILIGGNNGSGKTTLLNSIKIGLYGSHSTGLTTNTINYLDSIDKLLNLKAKKQSNSDFYIEIKYRETENFDENVFVLRRSWKLSSSSLRETVDLYKNNKKLSKNDYVEYISSMKVKNHPKLVSSLLFDGEKIARIIEDDAINEYIREVFNSTFNIEFYNSMNDDIQRYIEKESKNATLSQDELNLLDQRTKVMGTKSYIKDLNKRLNARRDSLHTAIEERNLVLEEYQNYGGLSSEEMEKFKLQLSFQEKSKKDNWKMVMNYLEEVYPFAINSELLLAASKNIIDTLPLQLKNIIDFINSTSELKLDLGKLNIMDLKASDLRLVHNVNQETYSELISMIEYISQNPVVKYRTLSESVFDGSEDLSLLRKDLGSSENKDLLPLLENINKLNTKVDTLESDIEKLLLKLEKEEKSLKEQLDVEDIYEKTLFSSKKSLNSFTIANKIIKINNLFKSKLKEKKLSYVENLTSSYFRRVINKDKFIKRIKINRYDFDLELYSFENELLPTSMISAGEKQVLMGCLVRAIYELSKRTMPLVFDTPLARLDSNNRKSFVNEIISKAGNQVIVLSTDKEIIGDLKDDIENKVNKKYLLKNNGVDSTKVLKSYFRGA